MTTDTLRLTLEQARELVRSMNLERWSNAVTLADGTEVRVRMEYDTDARLEDTDSFGTLHWPERDSRARPAGCDGAARKVQTRSGYVWWQPPSDVLGDAKVLESLHERVQAYFLEHWTYVGVVVQVTFPACTCCGERKHKEASLFHIESDAGDYFAEVVQELASEALSTLETH
jgi:hypothetical protein